MRGNEVDRQADLVGGAESGWADCCDVPGKLGEVEELGAAMEGFDGVGAGKDEPVIGAQAGQSGVKGGEGCGRGDLDCRNKDWGGSEGFELNGEFGGLMTGSRDQDALVGKGKHFDDSRPRVWLALCSRLRHVLQPLPPS